MADARVDFGGGRPEGRVGVRSGRRRRVGDAPVDPPGIVAEVGADLTRLVAQGDHRIEALAGEGVQVPGAAVGEVDAEVLPHDPHRVGMQCGLGMCSGAARFDAAIRAVAQQRFGDDGTRAVAGAHEQHRRCGGGVEFRWRGAHSEGRVQRRSRTGEQFGAAVQIQVVVGVTAVVAAARGGHQPAVAQQSQVIGDEILRFAHAGRELTHPVVAARQLRQQPPPDWMGGKLQEWWNGVTWRRHTPSLAPNTSNRFDVFR